MKLNEIAVDRYAGLSPKDKLLRLSRENVVSWQGMPVYNDDGTIDIRGHFTVLPNVILKKIPIKLREVTRNFTCNGTSIRTLDDFPDVIGGNFNVSSNKLTNIEGIPADITGEINVSYNRIKSLKGIQSYVKSLDCSHNELMTLKGGPEQITYSLECANNDLTNLDGCPEVVGELFDVQNNPIDSLIGIEDKLKECSEFQCGSSDHIISEGGIGLIRVEGMAKVTMEPSIVGGIISKHLDLEGSAAIAEQNIFECQMELIEAGFEEYAKL